jgi:hypothetical protein
VVLAPRGLREEEDGTTKTRMAQEFFVAVQRQARRVWIQTAAATLLVTAAALVYAFFLR